VYDKPRQGYFIYGVKLSYDYSTYIRCALEYHYDQLLGYNFPQQRCCHEDSGRSLQTLRVMVSQLIQLSRYSITESFHGFGHHSDHVTPFNLTRLRKVVRVLFNHCCNIPICIHIALPFSYFKYFQRSASQVLKLDLCSSHHNFYLPHTGRSLEPVINHLLRVSIMGWRCCECRKRHQLGPSCEPACGHRKCGRCEVLIQGKVAQAQAEGGKGQAGPSKDYDQRKSNLKGPKGCHGCGRNNHSPEQCFVLHPELRQSFNRGETARVRCSECGKSGHSQEGCYDIHPELRPQAQARPACSHCGKSGHPAERCFRAHPEQRPKDSKEDAHSQLCFICGKWGHLQETCYRAHPDLDPDFDEKRKPCLHCGKPGHVEAKCWKLHPEVTPPWAGDQYEWCRHCQKSGHRTEKCWKLQPGLDIERIMGLKERIGKPKEGKRCERCGRWGHVQEDCWGAEPERAPETVKGKFVREQDEENVNRVSIALADLLKEGGS